MVCIFLLLFRGECSDFIAINTGGTDFGNFDVSG